MIHNSQFIISKKAWISDRVKQLELDKGWILSYSENLSVLYSEDKKILLLGYAWKIDEDQKTPWEEIREFPDCDILKLEERWCGKYALIVDGDVYLDATGQLGVFYSDMGISSSCSLLVSEMGLPEKLLETRGDLNFLLLPQTQYPEIKKQLPSQIYNYHTGSMRARRLTAQKLPEFSSEQELMDLFLETFCTGLKNMFRMFSDRKILLTLTGGTDSRTVLAFTEHAGLDYECFTSEHDAISIGDVEMPKVVCEKLGRGYTYIERNEADYSKSREDDYNRHTAGLANDGDKLHYAYGQYQKVVEKFGKCVFVRGSIWEIGRDFYRKFIGQTFDEQAVYDHFDAMPGTLMRDSLEQYFKWCAVSPQEGISDCNRFYWEQRMGSWLSSIEQGFDLLDGVLSLQPLNNRYLMTLLLQFNREERLVKKTQRQMISYACPALADVPYGVEKSYKHSQLYTVWDKVKRACHRLRSVGVRKTVVMYIKIIKVELEKKRISHSRG